MSDTEPASSEPKPGGPEEPAAAPEAVAGPAWPIPPGRALLLVLGWAIAVPFFLLPGPLTIEAPDIYGGFGLHIRIAAALALVGAAVGVARVWLAPRVHEAAPPSRAHAAADLVLAVLLCAGLGVGVVAVSGQVGAWMATRELLGADPIGPSWTPSPLAVVVVAAVTVRAGLDQRAGWALRLLVLGLLFGSVLAWLRVAFDLEVVRSAVPFEWGTIGACAVLCAAWGPIAGARWLPPAAWVTLALLLLGPVGYLAGADLVHGFGPAGQPPLLTWTSLGGLAGALGAGLVALQLSLAARACEPRGPLWLAPWSAAGHLALAALLAVASTDLIDYSTIFAESWAFLLEPVRGALQSRADPRELEPWIEQGWLLALVLGGLLAGTGVAVRRWVGGMLCLWGLLVLGQLADLTDQPAAWSSGRAGLLILPVALSWLWLLRSRWTPLAWAGLVGLMMAGPVLAWYFTANMVVRPLPASLLIGVGVVAGGLLVLPLALGGRSEPVGGDLRVTGLVFLSVAGVMPIYIGVCLGLYPGLSVAMALALAACSTALWLLARRRGKARLLYFFVAAWLFYYGCTAAMTWFKFGPSEEACRSVLAGSRARIVLDRYAEGGLYLDAQPYDVLPVARHGAVLATYKRIDGTAGFIELMEADRPSERSRMETWRGDRESPLWPERMEYDPVHDAVITQLLGTEDYALWDVRVKEPDGDDPRRLRIATKLEIGWEPGNPALDVERRRLVLTYVPNRNSDNPLFETFDLDGLSSTGSFTRYGARLEMSDFAAIDPDTGHWYVPAYYDAVRFVLVEFDDRTGLVRRQRETAFGSIGLAADRGRLYLTSSLAGGLYVFDLADLSIVQVLPAGRFPRDLVLDRQRQRLYVGGYADGVVYAWSTAGEELEPLYQVEVGSLLRGLGLEPETGRVYAASGCGLFEVGEEALR